MRWNSLLLCSYYLLPLCLAIGFDSTVIATNNFSLITTLPSSSTQCSGCNVDVGVFQFDWYSEIFTHTAATIVKYVNNATNVTRTSTIRASNFTLPTEARNAALQVSGLVITTDMGGIIYTLTYPTGYKGVDHIASYTQSLITDSDGNLKCVTSTAYLTREFLTGQYPSIDGFYSSVWADCKGTLVSPPYVLVPVLSLTETETNYENAPAPKTSAVKKASPSKPIIAPTVTPTSTFKTIPQPAPQTIDSRPTSTQKPVPTTSNVEILQSSLPSPRIQLSSRASESLGDRPLPSIVIVSESQLVRSRSENVDVPLLSLVIASAESAIPSLPGTLAGPIVSEGEDNPPSVPSATPRTPIASPEPTPQLLLPIGSSFISANPDGNFVVADQTLAPGGPPIKALGNSLYLPPSKAAAIINGITVSLVQAPAKPSDRPPPLLLPIGSTVISENSEGNFVIAGQTLTPGGPPVSALGKSIYIQPSRSAAVIDGNTVPLAPAPQILTFGTQALEKEKAGGFIIGSQTLVPGEAPITVAGTRISLALSASALIIGSQTLTQQPSPTLPAGLTTQALISANTASEYLIAGQTLVPGAPPISIAGEPVSLARGESYVVIGSSTKSLSSDTAGLASLILNGFGDINPGPASTGLNATFSATLAPFTGGAMSGVNAGSTLMGLSFLIGLGMII